MQIQIRTVAKDQCFPADNITFVQLIRAWLLLFWDFCSERVVAKVQPSHFVLEPGIIRLLSADFLPYLNLSVMVTREQTGNTTDVPRQEKVAPEEKIEQVFA